jgi:hypothetical protein
LAAAAAAGAKRSCSFRCRGVSGWFGVVARSGSTHTWESTIADGTPEWYSSDESDENPSSPISSS